jgi:hypothetical protein
VGVAEEQDWSLLVSVHFSKRVEIQVAVAGCVVFAVGDGERPRLEWEEKQTACDVGYVDMRVGSGIEEASFEARLSHGAKVQNRLRRPHRHPSFPSRRNPRGPCVRLHLHTAALSAGVPVCGSFGGVDIRIGI